MITTEQIKKLREATGGGVMECKRALEETGGDMKKASELLKKWGVQKSEKKVDRASMNPKDVKALLKQEYIRDPSVTIENLIKAAIGKLGENIKVLRFTRYQLGEK